MAANRLTQRDDLTVTLINPRPDFVERIRLHQLIGGTDDAIVGFREVLAERVRLVVGTVTRIDAAGRTLSLADGDPVGYDYLVYAVGSGTVDQHVPGATDFAYPVASLEEARRLRPVLDRAPAAPVTVIGAGPAGIETATELAEAGRPVTLVCGGVLGPYLHPRGRRSVARRMAALGVHVIEGPGTRVTAVTPAAVRLADGRELPAGITIWTTGFGVPDLAVRSGLTTDTIGRLVTDETLTSVDDVRIIAAGDSAAPSELAYRMGCQSAVQLGPQAAETVLSRIAGKTPAPATVGFAGQCISLGRRSGIFQFSHRDDIALRLYVGGRLGARLKELVCRSTVKQLAHEARKPGARKWWVKEGKRARRLKAAQATEAAEAAQDRTPAVAERAAQA
ncbi:NAD(P)/FAD-dependent oxidoreductase [Streptomyces sp. NPDC056716]|uniref:NAD(P)/FAD-dependent oxidoreductase n=1 Tax=unclassified Streptomyces TaxID=2593676 RepID=UPI0036CA0C98